MFRLPTFGLVAALGAALSAQNPCFDLDIGADLALGDDDTAQGLALGFPFVYAGVTYTDVCVCSNGYIWFGPTSVSGGDYSPTEGELLSGAPRLCPLWNDFNPTASGSGHVYFNAVPASGSTPAYALVTWARVYEFGSTNPVSFQVRFDPNGAITITYGANAALGGSLTNAMILGASPGMGASSNPVTFATRPVTVGSDTFAEVLPTAAWPYAGASLLFAPTAPGYAVTDVPCAPNAFPGPAEYERFGSGCPNPPTIYELFAPGTADLSGLSFTFVPNGAGGYTMLQIPLPYFTAWSNNLSAGDDSTHQVTLPFPFPYDGNVLSTVEVSSNGFVTLTGSNGSGCCAGRVTTLLSGQPRIAGFWTDLDARSAGGVYADLDPATGDFVVTWDNVPEYGQSGNPVSFQIALKPSGVFDIRLQTVQSLSSTHDAVTGFSGGRGAIDPGPLDLSATAAFDTGAGGTPLDLANVGGSLPQLGSSCDLAVTGIPLASNFCVLILGLLEAVPPIDLAALGAPGCIGYVDFLTGPTAALLRPVSGTGSAQFAVIAPNDPAFAGVQITCQGVADRVGNLLGIAVSNGVRLTLGL